MKKHVHHAKPKPKKPNRHTGDLAQALGNDCMALMVPQCKILDGWMGLEMDPKLPIEDWGQKGAQLNVLDKARKFMLGDWVNFGDQVYGEQHAQYLDTTGAQFETLMKIARVCKLVTAVRRRKELSFEHHEAVCKLSDEEQAKWLDIAVTEGLTRQELRCSIKAGHVIHVHDAEEEQDVDGGSAKPPAPLDKLVAKTKLALNRRLVNGIEQLTPEELDELFKALEPVGSVYVKLSMEQGKRKREAEEGNPPAESSVAA